jgi:hypothetical protein
MKGKSGGVNIDVQYRGRRKILILEVVGDRADMVVEPIFYLLGLFVDRPSSGHLAPL